MQVIAENRPCRLSIIIASSEDANQLERCLLALMSQVPSSGVEVLVLGVFSSDQEKRFGKASFVSFPAKTPGPHLWGAGLALACGSRIAVTESRTLVDDGWIRAALSIPLSDQLIIGGVVEPLKGKKLTDWAAYFCDYGAFMRPLEAGKTDALPGNNVLFTKKLLEHATEYTSPAFWKTYWCHALEKQGVLLVADPSLVVYDNKSYRFAAYLLRRFRHGRCFAGMRNKTLTMGKRLRYAILSPGLPLILFFRLVKRVAPKDRYKSQFARCIPRITLALMAWAIGECWGYLFGAGTSCQYV